MIDLSSSFSALSPNQKAMFLARVAHDATVSARAAYVRDYEHPEGVLLRKANEFVHRVTGYIMHVLNGTEGDGQDASVIAMIVENAKASGREAQLAEWLRTPN
jgi:hypothetical protein